MDDHYLSPVETAAQDWITDLEAGSYKRNAESTLSMFLEESKVKTFDEIDVQTIREFSRSLSEDYTKESAETHYSRVRAFLEWAVREKLIDRNPANTKEAEEPLPTTESEREPQFWRAKDRDYLLNRLTEQNGKAIDDEISLSHYLTGRDKVLFYVIALTGVRGAEILNDDNEDPEKGGHPLRQGLRWKHVDWEKNRLVVLGKSRRKEYPVLQEKVENALRQWKARLDPAAEDWPVFPQTHPPTLARMIGDELEEAGFGRETHQDLHYIDACREFDVCPPAITPDAARRRLKHYSEKWDLPAHGDEDDYLRLHGARRGLGDQLYNQDSELSQEILRHKSISTTHKFYRERNTEELAERMSEALEES